MERYLSSTELKQNLRRAKEYAKVGVVHVLDNGHSGYVLCSAEVFDRTVEEACGRAAWEAEAREACREGERDRQRDRVVGVDDVLSCEYMGEPWRAVVSRTAADDIAVEYDGEGRGALAHMLDRVCEDPAFGIEVEFQNAAPGVRKVLVPPHDILYRWDDELGTVYVLGIVRAVG